MRNILKQFGEKDIGSFNERFTWSIVRLTVFYSVTLIVILSISGFISYKAFSQRIGHRFRPTAFVADNQIVVTIVPTPALPTPDQLREDLLESFLIVNISLVVLAIMLSYFLALKTLAPIKKSYEEQQRFLSDVSHELRTPLAILRLDLEQDTSEQGKSRMEEVDRMSKLVGDILHLSRIEDRDFPISPVVLEPFIQTILKRVAPLANAKHITIRQEGPALSVMAHEELLGHALTNLIQNAITYNVDGGTITVSTALQGSQVCIAVTDTGTGIAPHDIVHVFKRFYRADKSRTRATGGSGLGLSIVQSAVERMGGSVHIESEVGVGTTVSILLPR